MQGKKDWLQASTGYVSGRGISKQSILKPDHFKPTMNNIGKYLIIIGAVIIVAGLILYLFGNRLHFLGRLPGDIRVEKPGFRFYFPITTMILASLALSLILNLIKKFL